VPLSASRIYFCVLLFLQTSWATEVVDKTKHIENKKAKQRVSSESFRWGVCLRVQCISSQYYSFCYIQTFEFCTICSSCFFFLFVSLQEWREQNSRRKKTPHRVPLPPPSTLKHAHARTQINKKENESAESLFSAHRKGVPHPLCPFFSSSSFFSKAHSPLLFYCRKMECRFSEIKREGEGLTEWRAGESLTRSVAGSTVHQQLSPWPKVSIAQVYHIFFPVSVFFLTCLLVPLHVCATSYQGEVPVWMLFFFYLTLRSALLFFTFDTLFSFLFMCLFFFCLVLFCALLLVRFPTHQQHSYHQL
jgi:hypothetical protein